MSEIVFNRVFSMPSSDTFKIKPIRQFVLKYLNKSKLSIDPFARNSILPVTYTNDINPKTLSKYHLEALEFLDLLVGLNVKSDLVILDMPYSNRQISECYKELGIKVTQQHTQNSAFYKKIRDKVDTFVPSGGIVLSFGWNSVGMGIKRNYKLIEVLLCVHGGSHNDTICIAEQKI